MTSLGIMTLSRGPYNELDKMSLFQDLKLKRRKVDSRCSSDGESLADTSTSSPDLLTPLSPKMCDQPSQNQSIHHQSQLQKHQQHQHQTLSATSIDSAATPPPTTPSPQDHHPIITVKRNLSVSPEHLVENPSTTTIDDEETKTNKLSYSNGNASVIRSVIGEAEERSRPRSLSPAPSSPISHRVHRSPPIHNILHHQLHQPLTATTSAPTPLSSSASALSSITHQIFQQHQQQQQQNPHVTVLVSSPRIKNENQHQLLSSTGGSAAKRMQTNFSPPSSIPNSSRDLESVVNAINIVSGHQQQQIHTTSQYNEAPNSAVQIQTFSQPVTTTHQLLKRSSSGQLSPPNSNNFTNVPTSSPHQLAQGMNIPISLPQVYQQQNQQIRIKRERSPSSSSTSSMNQSLSIIPTSSQHFQPLSPHQLASNMMSHGSPIQQQIRHQQQQQQQQQQHQHQQQQQQMRDAALLFRVKNEPQSIPQIPVGMMQNRMIWGAQARINGVKPEVIGGPLPPLRPQVSPQTSPKNPSPNQTPPQQRTTPTVIMGESCGVRTMVWGFEPIPVVSPPQQVQTSTPPNQTPPSTSHNNNSNSSSSNHSSNNEEAAHLLLSLGQGQATRQLVESRSLQRPPVRPAHALNMERLWAGDYSQLPAGQQMHALNLSAQQQQQQQQWLAGHGGAGPNKFFLQDLQTDDAHNDEDDQPLVCMICEDKATGLHYGIITCEGCKGFFKRTVQNRRVYTCVADGTCEITKAQRNRCQYCRFKKCIEQGMVLQAVREDRMPGGRNSGAVYNLYKVKYKKHKKNNQKQANMKGTNGNSADNNKAGLATSTQSLTNTPSPPQIKPENNLSSNLLNGNILKAALTNPSEIVHLRHRLDNAVSSSRDRSISYELALTMIQTLIECDAMEDIATLPHFSEFLEDKSEIGDKLCNIGDSIVHKLVSWTKKLPFYLEIPVEIHTKLLTDKWHEILVLTTVAYQAMHGRKYTQSQQNQSSTSPHVISPDKHDPEFVQEITAHLHTLQTCLTTLMGHPISMEQLKLDVGLMVEKMTQITIMFRRIKLKMEEYVCLKVYILLNKEVELESIQERYVQVLRSYLQHTQPHNPSRLTDLLAHIPEIQTAANLLLESKMFYVPFVLNSASAR